MELNVQAAKDALANPSAELRSLLLQAPQAAQDALAPHINGASSSSATGSALTTRLQVVDEEKQFTYGAQHPLCRCGP